MLFKCRLERQVKNCLSTIIVKVEANNEYEAAHLAEKAMGKGWHFMAIVKKK